MQSIEKLALQWIGENTTSPDVFVEGSGAFQQIRDSVNDAIQEMASLKGTHIRTYHLITLPYRQFYRMEWPRDEFCYVIEAFSKADARKLEQTNYGVLHRRDWRILDRTGTPEVYWHVGLDYVGLYPIPTTSGKVIELRCVAVPRTYTSDDDPIRLREQFQRGAAHLAVSEYFASRGDAKRAEQHYAQYIEVVGLEFLQPRVADAPWQRGDVRGQFVGEPH